LVLNKRDICRDVIGDTEKTVHIFDPDSARLTPCQRYPTSKKRLCLCERHRVSKRHYRAAWHGGRQRHLVSAPGVFCTCNSSCAVPLSLIGWETYSKSAPCHCTNRKYKWRRCSKSIWRERPLPLGNPPSDAPHMQTHGNHTSAQWPNPVHRVSI